MLTGSCLCGAVRFALTGPVEVVNYCHCSRCRKRTGSAFATVVHARSSDFEIISGKDSIQTFEAEGWAPRRFCRGCGSPLPAVDPEEDEVKIPAGLLDQDPGMRPSLHIMTGSKAPWYDIRDGLPEHEEFPDDW